MIMEVFNGKMLSILRMVAGKGMSFDNVPYWMAYKPITFISSLLIHFLSNL